MSRFHTPISIHEFPDFSLFANEFEIGKSDVIITHKFLAEPYIMPLKPTCSYIFYEDYEKGEPSESAVDKMRKHIKSLDCKRIIAVGGGSVLDAAKMLAIRAECTADIYSSTEPLERMPLVLVPTTCGTGSETSNIAVIYMDSAGSKMGKSGSAFFGDASVLIPQFLEKLPYDIFMYSLLDALIHGIEVYLSPNSHAFSNVYCAEAVRLILRGLRLMRERGKDVRFKLSVDFLRASSYAGIGLSNNPCGAIHACAMVFGGKHDTPHGMTNAIFMNSILKRYTANNPDGSIKDLAKIICEELEIAEDAAGAFNALNNLIAGLIKLDPLGAFGMEKTCAGEYASAVVKTQQRLIVNSYIEITTEEFTRIFEELY